MNIFGFGTDLVNINRIRSIMIKSKNFKKKIFSPLEIGVCEKRKNQYDCFAKRFAAKEAFSKALGIGIAKGLNFKEIIIKNIKSGKPEMKIIGKSKKITKKMLRTNNYKILITITDEKPFAAATVIIIKK